MLDLVRQAAQCIVRTGISRLTKHGAPPFRMAASPNVSSELRVPLTKGHGMLRRPAVTRTSHPFARSRCFHWLRAALASDGWRDQRAQAFPGAHALWAIRAGRLLRNSLFFSVFALHVAAFGDVPTESSRGEKSCDAGK
jgi:hypothetical protein